MNILHRLELLFASLTLLAAVIFLIGVLSKLDGTVILGSSEGMIIAAIVYLTLCSIVALCSYLHVRRGSNIAGVVVILLGGLFFLAESYLIVVSVLVGQPINLFLVPVLMMTVFIGLTAVLALVATVFKTVRAAQDVA